MKICAIICEYNPFHNGHEYLLKQAKELSGADAILCIMSGNFVQRGEGAILEKHERAALAVEHGADMVIELPTVFATSNAEIFARGAVSILSKIPQVTHLCFGVEYGTKEDFLKAAKLLANEPPEVSEAVKALTAKGMSYAAALTQARQELLQENLLSSPNNILGLEYTKAIIASQANIEILPVTRVGGKYHDKELHERFPSATAIRKAYAEENRECLKAILPDTLYAALENANVIDLSTAEKLAILNVDAATFATTLDCNEGLENAFKKAALLPDDLETTLTSARYTASRIRRIALQNLLGIRKDLIFKYLSSALYIRPLAYKAEQKELLSILSQSQLPFLACGKDKENLDGVAAECFAKDLLAENVYTILSQKVYQNKTIVKRTR